MASNRKAGFKNEGARNDKFPRGGRSSGADIIRKRRAVPEERKKYGAPEAKKELLTRLASERKEQEHLRELKEKVASKNGKEFRFGYYTVKSDMRKNVAMCEDDLKKLLKYVDSEIKRCEARIQHAGVAKVQMSKHIKFDSSDDNDSKAEAQSEVSDAESGCSERDATADSSTDNSAEESDSNTEDSLEKERSSNESESIESETDGLLSAKSHNSDSECEAECSIEAEYDEYYNELLVKRKNVIEKIAKLKCKKRR